MLKVFTNGRNDGIDDRGQHIPAPFIMSRRAFVERFPLFDEAGLTGAGVFYRWPDAQSGPYRLFHRPLGPKCGRCCSQYCAAERL